MPGKFPELPVRRHRIAATVRCVWEVQDKEGYEMARASFEDAMAELAGYGAADVVSFEVRDENGQPLPVRGDASAFPPLPVAEGGPEGSEEEGEQA